MIQKLISIKNVGRFRNYGAKGDLTFTDTELEAARQFVMSLFATPQFEA